MSFLSKLIYEDIDGDSWRLVEPLGYACKNGNVITVPAGFVTDLASIPRFFHRVFPKSGLHNYAAVIHDYIYATACLTKTEADKIFLEAMIARGVPKLKAQAMYHAVRWFGFAAWNNHRKQNEALTAALSRN